MILSSGIICVGTDPRASVMVMSETGLEPRHFTIDTAASVARLQVFEGCKVWLNGQPVQAAELRNGDLIAAGALELRFVDDAGLQDEAGGALPPPPPRPPSSPSKVVTRDDVHEIVALMVASLLGFGMAIWMGYIGFMAPVPPHVGPNDVVTREARLISIQPHPGWLEAHLDVPIGNRRVEMPKRLFGRLFHVSWPCREELCGKKGWPAVLGFERSVLNGPASDPAGGPIRLPIITLEVDGVVYGDRRQHNDSMRDAASTASFRMLCLIMLAGLAAAMSLSKWRTARSWRHYATSGS